MSNFMKTSIAIILVSMMLVIGHRITNPEEGVQQGMPNWQTATIERSDGCK